MTDERDEIRARIDIVQLVGTTVRLERAGKRWKGLCPFHPDKTPSLNVEIDGRYKCFACGEYGDIFTWVMKTQNVDFPEAMRILARQAGVELRDRSKSIAPSQRETYAACMSEAQKFFREQFERSEIAQSYCRQRGLDEETIESWGIGYSPEGNDSLAGHLKRKGFALSDGKSLFLVDQDSQGGYFDKFRGRLMFPIWTERGDLVAFGGRLLGQGNAKYINSGDTPIYRKSRVLYGMNRAQETLRKDRTAILVEGYLDVIACHRAGVTGALASLGTALTDEQTKLLKRWVEQVVILYDSDSAGQRAAEKATVLLTAEGLKVRVALMPAGEDPDTLLKTLGAGAVREAVERGLSPMDYRMHALDARLKPSEEDYWPEAIKILAEAPSELELQRHLMRLASQYPGIRSVTVAEQALRRDVLKMQRQMREQLKVTNAGEDRQVAPVPRTSRPKNPLSGSEIIVFQALLSERFRKVGWQFCRASDLFGSDLAVRISASVKEAFPTEPPAGPTSTWLHRIEPMEIQEALGDLIHDSRGANLSEIEIEEAVRRLHLELGKRKLALQMREDLTPAERMQIFRKMKELNPDRNAKPDSDTLF